MRINKKVKTNWIQALRSDKYEQGRHRLRTGNRYCCLGVLCDMSDGTWVATGSKPGPRHLWEFHSSGQVMDLKVPENLRREIGLWRTDEDILISMNDDGKSFKEIADWIEENL